MDTGLVMIIQNAMVLITTVIVLYMTDSLWSLLVLFLAVLPRTAKHKKEEAEEEG